MFDDSCDCKFGYTADRHTYSEQTGCPELRQAVAYLKGQRDEVFVLERALEKTAVNKLGAIRRIIETFDEAASS